MPSGASGSSESVDYLDLDDLLSLARVLLGDPVPLRDVGLLEAAVARPRTTVFGDDAYPDLVTKAAALLQSIVKGHALVDGNKRLAWLATGVFLRTNGISVGTISNDDVVAFVEGVAAGDEDVGAIAERLRDLLS